MYCNFQQLLVTYSRNTCKNMLASITKRPGNLSCQDFSRTAVISWNAWAWKVGRAEEREVVKGNQLAK